MNETGFPPPTPQQSTGNLTTSPALTLRGLAVSQTPAGFVSSDAAQQLTGKVLSYSEGTLRISTAQGTFSLNTPGAAPPIGTEITIELYMQKAALRANIAVLRQQSNHSEALQQARQAPAQTPPPLPLKAGDTMTGLLLADTPADPPLTLQQAAQIIEQVKAAGLQKLPQPLPASTEVLQQLITSKNIHAALKQLSPADQKNILRYISTHMQQLTAAPSAEANTIESLATKTKTPQPTTASATPTAAPNAAPAAVPTIAQRILPAQIQALLPILQNFMPGATHATPNTTLNTMAAQSPVPPSLAQAPPPLLPKNTYDIRIAQVTPPQSNVPTTTSGQLQGQVELITPAGYPAIKTAKGSFILKTSADVPVGSTVTFTATPLSAGSLAQAQAADKAAPFTPLNAITWPALNEALQVLAQVAPQLAANMHNSLPTLPRLAPTALFFLAALRTGTIESWLGPNALDSLRQNGKKDLAEKLTGDFSRLSTQSKTPLAGDWRGISMPLLHDDILSQMQFYVRHQPEQEDGEEPTDVHKKDMTRFILNLHLSRMGDIQLDGLMRQKKLDLVLRTADKLSESMRRDLMQRYATGLEHANMRGSISFQPGRQQWVTVSAGESDRNFA